MSDAIAALLSRAQNELGAARILAREGFGAQATSRAYYAAFFAAEAALLVLDETRSKHSAVIAAFGRLVVKDGGLDPAEGATLRSLFELRNAADYSWLDEPAPADLDAISMAESFVASVAAWISAQG